MRKQTGGKIVNITYMGRRIAIPIDSFTMQQNLLWRVYTGASNTNSIIWN
jgi:hypothetical protein